MPNSLKDTLPSPHPFYSVFLSFHPNRCQGFCITLSVSAHNQPRAQHCIAPGWERGSLPRCPHVWRPVHPCQGGCGWSWGLLQVSGNSILWRPSVVYIGHSAATSTFLVLGQLALVRPKIGSKQGFLLLGQSLCGGQVPSKSKCLVGSSAPQPGALSSPLARQQNLHYSQQSCPVPKSGPDPKSGPGWVGILTPSICPAAAVLELAGTGEGYVGLGPLSKER